MSLEQKIDKLIENVLLLTGKVEQRAKANDQNTAQASHTLVQASQSVSGATTEIQRITSHTVGNAIQKPVVDLEHSLKIMRDELIRSTNNVGKHMQESTQKLKHIVWLSIGAFVLAGLVTLGASVYAFTQANQKIKQADWVSSINAAIANGKLSACSDGGICANIDKKQVRLDK